MTLIGVVCPKCKQFTTEQYKVEDYQRRLEEFVDDVKEAEVINKLDGKNQINAMYIPIPIFYCERCGGVVETGNSKNSATLTELNKWRERYGT